MPMTDKIYSRVAAQIAANATDAARRDGGSALERVTAIRDATGPNPITDGAAALVAAGGLEDRADTILDEIARIDRHEKPTRAQRERRDVLLAEAADLERARVNADRAALRQYVAGGGAVVERGTPVNETDGYDRDPYGGRRGPELMTRTGNPWAPDAVSAYGPQQGRQMRDAARAACERSTAPDTVKQRITVALEGNGGVDSPGRLARWTRATSDPAYSRAFAKLIRDPQNGHREFDDDELRAFRAVREEARSLSLTDSAGGLLVPFAIDPAILLSSDGSVSPIRQIARNVITTSDVHNFVSSEGMTVGFAAEFAEANDDSPTLEGPAISVHKAQGFVPISIEAIEDAANIEQEVARLFVDAVAQLESDAFVTGTGSGEPFGFVTALAGTGSAVPETTADQFTAADVFAVEAALPPRFRPNAQWVANLSTIHTAQQFETTNGALKFPEIAEGRLNRRPLHEVSAMDGTLTGTSDNHILAIGDWSQFCVVDRVGTSVEPIQMLFGASGRPNGTRGWYMHKRFGSDVLVDNAFRVLNVSVA